MLDLNDKALSFCLRAHTVEETIEVTISKGRANRKFRIKALKDEKGKYWAEADLEELIGGFEVWTSYVDLPTTSGDTAEQVLRLALSDLAKQCDPIKGNDS